MKAERPAALKSCVDQDYFESLLSVDFIADVLCYDKLRDAELWQYLGKRAVESKKNITIEPLDRFMKEDLQSDMRDGNAFSCMVNLLIFFHALSCRHDVRWANKESDKFDLRYITYAARPEALRT